MQITIALLILGLIVFVLIPGIVFFMYFQLWLHAKASGVNISVFDMLFMRLRKVDPHMIVDALISMTKAGLNVGLDDVESHYLAGGDLHAVVAAAIRVDKADLGIDYRTLAAIDLAGRDVLDAVNTHVSPKVLACPAPTSKLNVISGVCRDGIRITASARVTVRTRLDRLVGGAGEETIVARVGEGIVSVIGRSDTHKAILASPELISKHILEHGLDSGTCFEIISVDIADINVEENIGARLRSEQATADKRVAQARAEQRRAAAVDEHTEMQARTTESKSRVEASRSNVPLAVAGALKDGKIGALTSLPPTFNAKMRWQSAASNN
jgi:uncharacterized protein YqfA (UPF0365 family)